MTTTYTTVFLLPMAEPDVHGDDRLGYRGKGQWLGGIVTQRRPARWRNPSQPETPSNRSRLTASRHVNHMGCAFIASRCSGHRHDAVSWPDSAHDNLLCARRSNCAREQNPAVGIDSYAKPTGGTGTAGHPEINRRQPAGSKARIRATIWIEADQRGEDAHGTDK